MTIQIPINIVTFPIQPEELHSAVHMNHVPDKSMKMFVVSEKQGQILLPLPALLQRLDFLPIALWAFREVTIRYPLPFGLSVAEFERLTRELAYGFVVSDGDFRKFLNADFQFIDGWIEGYTTQSLQILSFKLECIDTSIWEITTTSDEIAKELERRGFKR